MSWTSSPPNFEVDTLKASSLSGTYLEGRLQEDHSEVDLVWSSLPTGFSWSLYCVQMTIESIMTECLESTGSRIMNDRALPATFIAGNRRERASGSNHFVFVDNLGVFGVGKASVNDKLSYACDSFNERGLNIHEQEVQPGIVHLPRQPARLSGTQETLPRT